MPISCHAEALVEVKLVMLEQSRRRGRIWQAVQDIHLKQLLLLLQRNENAGKQRCLRHERSRTVSARI